MTCQPNLDSVVDYQLQDVDQRDAVNLEVGEGVILGSKDHLNNWMSLLPQHLKTLPLSHLCIPGSHDAGSYDLKVWSKIRWDTIRNPKHGKHSTWHKLIPYVTRPLIKRWGKTQQVSLYTQLDHGIRYFDIRVAQKTTRGDFFFVHGLYGPRVSVLAEDVNTFLNRHPGEVVIFHVQHIFQMSAHRQRTFFNQLKCIFGNKICPVIETIVTEPVPSTSAEETSCVKISLPSLNYLISKKYQVLIFFPNETPIQSNLLWPSELISNPWPNTICTVELIAFLDAHNSCRPPDRLHVTQGVLTPNFSMPRLKVVSTLKKQLAIPCNRSLCDWIKTQSFGCNGPNIVMTDFVDHNHYSIPRLVVSLNYPNQPFPSITPFTHSAPSSTVSDLSYMNLSGSSSTISMAEVLSDTENLSSTEHED